MLLRLHHELAWKLFDFIFRPSFQVLVIYWLEDQLYWIHGQKERKIEEDKNNEEPYRPVRQSRGRESLDVWLQPWTDLEHWEGVGKVLPLSPHSHILDSQWIPRTYTNWSTVWVSGGTSSQSNMDPEMIKIIVFRCAKLAFLIYLYRVRDISACIQPRGKSLHFSNGFLA